VDAPIALLLLNEMPALDVENTKLPDPLKDAKVPVALGNVIVTVTASVGVIVVLPLVAPFKITLAIMFPLTDVPTCSST
jgi:hypothetical protein